MKFRLCTLVGAIVLAGCTPAVAPKKEEPPPPAVQAPAAAPPPEPATAAEPQVEALPPVAMAAAPERSDAQYATDIRRKIARFLHRPRGIKGNPQAEFIITLQPGGRVSAVKLAKSSGQRAYDRAVERAIRAASPLPVPEEPARFEEFRTLRLKFRAS